MLTHQQTLGLDLAATQIITPNQRLALFLSRDWGAQQALDVQLWRPLAVMPWNQWLESLWHEVALQLSLQQIQPLHLLSQDGQLQFWRERAGAQAKMAMEADQLSRIWGMQQENSACNEHQLQLKKWQQEYADYKRQHDFADGIDMVQLLQHESELLQETIQTQQIQTLLFYGFIEWTPLQKSFIQLLQQLGLKIIDDVNLKTNLKTEMPENQTVPSASTHLHLWPDIQAELYGAAHWALDRWHELAQSPEWAGFDQQNLFDGPRIAVVVPDLAQNQDMVRALFHEVLQWQGDFNPASMNESQAAWTLSAGIPMSDYPLLMVFLLLMDLTFDELSQTDLEYLLNSPHWAENVPHLHLAGSVAALRQQGRTQWQLTELRHWLVTHLEASHPLFDVLVPMLDQLDSLQVYARQQFLWSEWLSLFQDVIEIVKWPGEDLLNSEEFQLMQRWHNWWLSQEEQAIGVEAQKQTLFYRVCRQKIEQDWREIMFQPEASTDRILVLGMLEAAALPLDDVFITGLSASLWPASSQPNPFLPYGEQRALQIPRSTPLREIWYGEALLKLYDQSSPGIHLSYPNSIEDVPQFVSPLVSRLFPEALKHEEHRIGFAERLLPELVEIDDHLPMLEGRQPLIGASRSLSQQAICPFLGSLQSRGQIKPLDPVRQRITGADRGSWLHRVLELLWQSWRSPEHVDRSQVAVLIQQQVQQVMAHARAVLPGFLTTTLLAVESKRLERLVSKSVALELQRGHFKVEGIEQKIRLLVDDFEFDLRLDRWDSTAEGLVLIDYKTSVPMTSTERLVTPQLILYAMALGQILGLTEAEMAQQICEAVYFAMKPSSGVKWINLADEDWFQQERKMLQTLLEEIRSGRAELEPLQGERTCSQCDYQSYCRVGYRR